MIGEVSRLLDKVCSCNVHDEKLSSCDEVSRGGTGLRNSPPSFKRRNLEVTLCMKCHE